MTRKLSSTKEGSMESTFEAKPYTGKTAFEQWVEYEGIPMIRDFIVPDLNSLALRSWDRVGAAGSWLVLGAPEDQLSMAAYVCEIGIFRVEAREPVLAAVERLAPAFQWLRSGTGALRGDDQCSGGVQYVS